jgi:hypothetical protein
LVDALRTAANMTVSPGFQPNQGGWHCLMRDPRDLSILRPLVAADPHADEPSPPPLLTSVTAGQASVLAAELGVQERRGHRA